MIIKYVTSLLLVVTTLINPQGKTVAVVGNGSSGIQIVPAMLPDVPHIDHYVRSRTWISPSFAREELDKREQGVDNFRFSDEEIRDFKADHQSYQVFRKSRC